MLADPNRNYTTHEILKQVGWECDETVSLRMIQKDIKALEEEFGKELIRNAGRRGTVKYADQSEPLFYQELTSDEEVEDIYFAVYKKSLPYIQTKFLHGPQIELDKDSQKMFRARYPALKFANIILLRLFAYRLGKIRSNKWALYCVRDKRKKAMTPYY